MPESGTSALDSLTMQRDAAASGEKQGSVTAAYIPFSDGDSPLERVVGAPISITKRASDDSDTPVAFVQSGERRRVDIAAALIGVGSVDPSLLSAKGKQYRKSLLGQ